MNGSTVAMRLSFNSANVYTQLVNVYQKFTRNMKANDKTQMVLSRDTVFVASRESALYKCA